MDKYKSLIIASILFFAIPLVKAQTPSSTNGLAVSPPTFELSGNPGQVTTNAVRLENLRDAPVRVVIDKRNFSAVGEEGAVDLSMVENTYSLASWITVDPGEVVIPAKSTRTFNFSIRLPLNAEPGGHFGSIIFRTVPDNTLSGSGATVAQEIGALVLLKVAGATTEDAMITSFLPTQQLFEKGPITFITKVENLGNVHIKPYGNIIITGMTGKKIVAVDVESKNVLPGSIRKLEGTWDTTWRIGRYNATLNLIYGENNTQLSRTTSFIVFPYRIAILLTIILAGIGSILYATRKRLKLAWKILTSGKA